MSKIVNLLTITSIIILLIVACQSEPVLEKISIEFHNEGEVFETGEFQTFRVELKDKAGERLEVDDVKIHINMERMNHPMIGTMNLSEDGVYEVELPLAMAGEWYTEITLTEEGEERVERFYLQAEGEMAEEFMRGYHADTGEVPEP
ncbi:hypothetical protein CR194_10440 [Salipaludibacillus keqinensis]|uniref:YtkA-like domain-containing protein n=1 Tax=Salipaludibacillus keqinensis TaxID=2045207 RepID=A0A323TLV6_9BACI|nr:FixH family protein [Salipaludibacillus keqinensis]PYZ93573.1 hypothetical protein CR194_10440 [Salipaludibacillus keqinensis]